jgi:hypothetical protein
VAPLSIDSQSNDVADRGVIRSTGDGGVLS